MLGMVAGGGAAAGRLRKKAASQAESLRQRYREMQAAHMEAEITCHLETENRTFTVSCDWTPTAPGPPLQALRTWRG